MAKNNKMTTCKSCETEIAKSAKTCPNCGAKNKKPIYKRVWFICLVVIILLVVVFSSGEKNNSASTGNGSSVTSTESSAPEEITYTAYTADQLDEDLEANALKAADKYDDQYVAVTGRLSNIDSSGKYISITSLNNDFDLIGIHCEIQNDEQKQIIMDLQTDDTVLVKGKITDVGEVMGYSMKIDSVEKQ